MIEALLLMMGTQLFKDKAVLKMMKTQTHSARHMAVETTHMSRLMGGSITKGYDPY